MFFFFCYNLILIVPDTVIHVCMCFHEVGPDDGQVLAAEEDHVWRWWSYNQSNQSHYKCYLKKKDTNHLYYTHLLGHI